MVNPTLVQGCFFQAVIIDKRVKLVQVFFVVVHPRSVFEEFIRNRLLFERTGGILNYIFVVAQDAFSNKS
jgi:hypothetical protein